MVHFEHCYTYTHINNSSKYADSQHVHTLMNKTYIYADSLPIHTLITNFLQMQTHYIYTFINKAMHDAHYMYTCTNNGTAGC